MWLTSVALATAAPGPATLEAPPGIALSTDAVPFTFSSPGTSFLDGCAPIELERREGALWVALPRVPCPTAVAATLVNESLTLSVPPPIPGEYRAVAAWGTECDPARPFALAGCKTLDLVRSTAFKVEAPAAKP
ncbi:hypothetical protein LBMAG42_02350 [Deltaproteobacteria bacterium]|nr:hypothetical protein LBMAG42_02350 [Deltaproteobacteria bacterium]